MCLFCKIIQKDIPAYVLYENKHACAFLDIHPRSAGHTVVIPKKHAEKLSDLPEEEVAPLFSAVKLVAGTIRSRLDSQGLTIGINEGKASGQEVDHLHVHVIPRFADDGGGSIQSVVSNVPKESLEKLREKLKIQ